MAGSVVDTFFKTSPEASAPAVSVDLGNVLKMLKNTRAHEEAQVSIHTEAMQSNLRYAEECRQYVERAQKRVDELDAAIAILGNASGMTD